MTAPYKSVRQRAQEYLAKREYAYAELKQKLMAFAENEQEVINVLEEFKQRGWLSDARYVEQVVYARKNKFGSLRLAHELREKGIDDTLITDAVSVVRQNEYENARKIWQKKFNNAPSSREEWTKQARFLQSRGFGFDTIKKVLSSTFENSL